MNNEDQMWLDWQKQESEIYDEMVYNSNPINTYINKFGHRWVEKQYSSNQHFSKVLEVGAGTGEHLDYVKHTYDEYIITDIFDDLLERAKKRHADKEKVQFEVQNATELPYSDNTFDRLISIYNLEHIPNPHQALREWRRVTKPGGNISIAIPTEGGIAWNLGRHLTTRRYFRKKGLNLDYIIAREHINTCYRIRAFLNYYFKNKKEKWFPSGIPTAHFNLIYCCSIINN